MEHPSFVMSKFAKKEDLLKSKAEYYQKACSKMEDFLEKLVAEWEVEGGFLDNDRDDKGDKSIGRTYKQCASELRNALEHNADITGELSIECI